MENQGTPKTPRLDYRQVLVILVVSGILIVAAMVLLIFVAGR